ncbi:uncharacterized protein LOC110730426 [Chenopodium quinoa]|uniref:uncharacterized protein LOC110730426 n=1 Tax=Chenopodium quinoa TaxID=63459 RepID=UPI000B76FE6B|nr:uncharacterized protein LOC110730426 [Chenopodium quinoa]
MAKKMKQNKSTPQLVQLRISTDEILQNLRNSSTTFVPSPIQKVDELITPAPELINPACGSIPRSDTETISLFAEAIARPTSSNFNKTVTRVSNCTVPLDAEAAAHRSEPATTDSHTLPPPEQNAHKDGEDRSSFSGKLTAKGDALFFFAPVVQNGKQVAKIKESELMEGNRKWSNALVFYVVSHYPTIVVVHRFIVQQWCDVQKPEIFWHDDGYFIINCCSISYKDTILCSGPQMFMGKPAIIKPWSPKFDFGAEILRTILLWVKFPNIPLNCWGPETLSRIGSLLGVPIFSDECTTRKLRVSFARVLIEIDVTKPLPKSMFVESPLKAILELKVVYEWTPPFCSKCNKVGHDCSVKVSSAPKHSVTAAPKQPVNVAPKVQQVWVAKPSQAPPVVDVDASVHGQSFVAPQVHTSQNSNEGWRIVGKKTKSQQTRVNQPASTSNAFIALFANEMDGVGGFMINPSGGEKKFGSSWFWLCNYDHSPKGRIWLGWNADRVTVNVLKIHEQFIHYSVSSKDLSTQIHLTVVYGLHSIHDRLPMWEGIRKISIQHSRWLCAGYFNYVLHTSDRFHGTDVTDYETRDFRVWIDRVFGNQAWLASHGHVETVYLPPSLSNHSPVLLDICSAPAGRGRPFRFLNCIADHPDFLNNVSQAWGFGSSVWQKHNYVKSRIKSLNSKQFGNIKEKIDQANVELDGIQNLMAQNPDDLELYAKETDAIKVVKHWNDIQESNFKQKFRINLIKIGDGNSHYFFSVMKNRQARNRIDSIFDSNQVFLKDPNVISHEVISFYKFLLGIQASWVPAVDLVTMRRGKQLSSFAQSYLIQPFSHAEIDAALKGIDNTKAPGIDGFNSFFFKRAWHIVKDDIYASVIDFFTKGTLPKQWNCTTITLVPKIPNASHVKDFRPIPCCTMVYKLISKVITARLATIIGEIIDDAQTGFILGKHIGDNILLATELIKGYDHKFISPRCMVKVDLKKAYDSVKWGFLITVMQELGFPQRFVSWI